MDYSKVLQMLTDPTQQQTVLSEVSKTLTAFGLTQQESDIFISGTVLKTPINDLVSKMQLPVATINSIYESALVKVQSKLKQ